MVNTMRLKNRIREKHLTQGDCAAYLGIKPPTLNQKINNIRHFTLSEAERLREFLDVSDNDFASYFFNQ